VNFPDRSRENPFVARLWATQRVGYLSAEKRKHGGSQEIDDEIRDLGDRFGIPTEFSSYLVVEPGMNRPILGGAAQLGQVVVTGAGTTRAAAPATVQFEAAKSASAQRSATNLSAADAAVGMGDSSGGGRSRSVIRAGNVTFVLRDSVWTDVRYKQTGRVLRVKPFSDAYFKLMELLPDLREPFSVGERAIVAGHNMAIELTPSGVEKLTDRDIALIRNNW
jgi:hypothetical protein